MRRKATNTLTGLSLLLLAGPSLADPVEDGASATASEPDESGKNAVIHFADINGIKNWDSLDNGEALLIEGRNDRWYKATFYSRCIDLPHEIAIGFVTDATGNLDRFGSVLVNGRECQFESLERVPPPEDGRREP